MSATASQADSVASAPSNDSGFSTWVPEGERPPTEADEAKARERNLTLGNETSIGLNCRTDFYTRSDLSKAEETRYKRLQSHNRDNYWRNRSDVDTPKALDQQIKRHKALAVTTKLELSDLQTTQVLDRLFQIDGQKFGHPVEAVMFCLSAVLVNKEIGRRYGDDRAYHPARNAENNSTAFARAEAELCETIGSITKKRIQSIFGKLTQGSPPTRDDDQLDLFVDESLDVQRHPSFSPNGTLPEPTGES